ncbi:MAG: ABC-F family ATP-binding cassette domain-containing protein [Psychroflexus sp.]|nr:ABC-F family ATP-binding cassette domain-containing protein [Psychroflexus sp.]
MNYVSVEQVGKSFGNLELFNNISFGINEGQKIGLIAKNGSGKTTLMNMLMGIEPSDEGRIVFKNGLNTAFLPQRPNLDDNATVKETIFADDNPQLKAIRAYEAALEDPNDADAYQAAFDQMEATQAWDFETDYQQILSKLQLHFLDQKVKHLSGGQQKRLALAQVLLKNPDMLIVDEPTNHLDLDMIEWLEEYFSRANLTLFMVTHDRYFLQRICNTILEFDQAELYTYQGNYHYYLQKRQERLEIEQKTTEKAQQLYKKELKWMRKQPKARTTKSKSRIEDFHQIKERASKRRDDHEIELAINMQRLGSKVIECHNITKQYDEHVLFKDFDYKFLKGERVGVIGKNGTGKSTLIKVITKEIEPTHGKVVHGETLQIGHYRQDGIDIKTGQKVIEVVREFGDYIPLEKGRELSAQQLLERFLFSRKRQYDYVEKLSGGEQKRLYLCTVLIQNPNFLILDEPTNDLDIITLNVLESFLLDFPGCVLLVSHDRYFMDKIVDHLFVLDEKKIKDYPGNYNDYLEYKEGLKQQKNADKKSDKSSKEKVQSLGNQGSGLSYAKKQEMRQLEKKIDKLEKEKSKIEADFIKDLNSDEIEERSVKLGEIKHELEHKTEAWMELAEKAEG